MTGYKIGVVTHYYSQLGMAIVDLTDELHVGDFIKIVGSTDFSQRVESIQVEHEQVQFAKPGDTIGLKVKSMVNIGDEICKSV